MANNIKAEIGKAVWYSTYENTGSKPIRTSFKLTNPATLIDNAPELSSIDSVTTDSYQGMLDYIANNNIDLNGHSIIE